MPELFDHVVGNFGWLDTPIPRGALWLYVVGAVILIAVSIRQLNKRQALALSLLLIAVVCVSIAIDMNFYAMFGWFGAQGRHIAPILVGVPLLAVSQIGFGKRVQIATVTGWWIVMLWAGLGALRRYTVGINGDNGFAMFTERTWNPAIGFWPAVILLVVSTLFVATTMANSQRALIDRSKRYR
jgi:hypothetical protein